MSFKNKKVFPKIRSKNWISNFNDNGPYIFPEGFMWGAAAAAQHVESQQPTDWTEFELSVIKNSCTKTDTNTGNVLPGHIKRLDQYSSPVRTRKTNYDALYPDDFKMARDMHHNAHRMSICWARLFPKPNMNEPDPKGVEFYRGIFEALKKNQLTPFVTLFHFSTPNWFWDVKNGQRGWEREDATALFSQFVTAVLDHFGEYIHYFCTINEPMVYVYNGYMQGIFPPLEKRKNIDQVIPVIKALLACHAKAYKLIKAHYRSQGRNPMVGIAKHTRIFHPLRNWIPSDGLAAGLIDQAFNWDFLDAIETGVLKLTNTEMKRMVPGMNWFLKPSLVGTELEIPGLKGTQDYVGINYYGRCYVETGILNFLHPKIHLHDKNDPTEIKSDLGWAVYPRGFFNILQKAYYRYERPIFVLENGIAENEMNDAQRQQFIVTHIKEMWNAMYYEKIDIRAYFHWTLVDNFEWAEGFTACFGLVKTDYENEFKRISRLSAKLYAQIMEDNCLGQELWDAYKSKSTNSAIV